MLLNMVASGQQPLGRRHVARELKILRPYQGLFRGHPVYSAAVLSEFLSGSSQRNSFESCCPRPERVYARSHRVRPSRASVRDRRDACVFGVYVSSVVYILCALFIAIAFDKCVVYARIWLLSGAKFKFPFCSLFPIHPPFVCNAPVSSVMRFCSPLGATSACMGGGRGGERALSGEGARRERDPGAGREP
mmetsp:Transcript_34381/g.89870  ORF Transcript_34381/g.89870 Transcript_34381/m.89870 type:complete len:191 (+) Transcript_34381:807-1379(+)